MYYEIYIDVVFVCNLFMDYILLRLVNRICSCSATRLQCLRGALVGAAGFCLALAEEVYQNPLLWRGIHIILCVLMLRYAGMGKGKSLPGCLLCWYMLSFFAGGILQALTGDSVTLSALFVSSIAGGILTGMLFVFFYKRIKNTAHVWDVILIHHGKQKKVKGLYDTGNRLYDSCTHMPVSVLEYGMFSELLSPWERESIFTLMNQKSADMDSSILKPHYIRYHSVGEKSGLLLAVTLEKIYICREGTWQKVNSPVVALSPEKLSEKEHFQMIIHPDCILR